MDSIVQSIIDAYSFCFYKAKDPRAQNWRWPFTESPPYGFMSLLLAFYFLIKFGPYVMKNRKPFRLKTVMIVYNAFQVIVNSAASIAAIYTVFIQKRFNWTCQPIDRTNDIEWMLSYIYFSFKVLDLFDTVFIVLRKHTKQLSFLHCYHHFLMVCTGYLGIMWFPGGMGILLGVINSIVHSFMYSYYFATAFKPELKNSTWFKKNITHLQLIQFMLLSIFFSRSLFTPSCNYPRFLSFLLLSQSMYMMYLFSKFYVKTYLKKKNK